MEASAQAPALGLGPGYAGAGLNQVAITPVGNGVRNGVGNGVGERVGNGAGSPPDALPPVARQAIRDELLRRGWTQAKLAQIVGTTESQMAQVLGGRIGVKLSRLRRIAAALDWSTATLLGEGPAAAPPALPLAGPAAPNAELWALDAVTCPVFAWGSHVDPTAPEAVEERRASPPSDQRAKIGPRGFAVEVPGGQMAGWGAAAGHPGIRPGDLAWVNPDRPATAPGGTVAAIGEHGTGLVVGEYTTVALPDGRSEPALVWHPRSGEQQVVHRGGGFRVVGRVVYVASGFTPL